MKKAFCYISALIWGLTFVFIAQGQDLGNWSSEDDAVEANVSNEPDLSRPKLFSATKCLGKTKKGYVVKRYLMIEYPWSVIQNSSLEVRIIGPQAESQPQFCKPVYFKTIYGKLDQIDKDIFNKKTGNTRYSNNIKYSSSLFYEFGLPEPIKLEFDTIKPVAGARADYFYMVFNNPESKENETTLVFHDLDQWAVDGGRLAIELHGRTISNKFGDKKDKYIEFDKPCKIMIWLLHDDYVVWEETFQWPGTEKDNPIKRSDNKKAVKQKKNGDEDDEDPMQAAKKFEDMDKNQNKEEVPEENADAGEDEDFGDFGEDF